MIESDRSALEVFALARQLLDNPDNWCCFAKARDKKGRPVHPGDQSAICWDLESAVGISDNTAGITPIPFLYKLDHAVRTLYPVRIAHHHLDTGEPEEPVCDYVAYESTAYVNDWCGHGAVLAILDLAIVLEKQHADSSSNG